MTTLEEIRATVQARYGATAQRVLEGATTPASCCGPTDGSSGCCGSTSESWDPITADLYEAGQTAGIPAEALLASLGCGNPTALADLREGEVVLDLGSGGGIDVLLSARRVGPTGKAYGLDMTDEMLALALENKARAGATNVEFLKGHIEAIPLPAASIDVVISNCVVNLATDKPAVFREIARVLRPGGRIGITDIVAEDHLTQEQRAERGSYAGCIAGALSISEFDAGLRAVGLSEISIRPTHSVAEGMVSAIVQATKPLEATPAIDLSRRVLPVAEAGGCCGGTGCC
jgi:arsenite methyltransferase